MKRIPINKLLVISIALFSYVASSIAGTEVKISNGHPNNQIKNKIELNASKILDKLYTAYQDSLEILGLEGLDISREGKDNIAELWDAAHFFCPEEELNEVLVRIPDGYQLRNIPVMMGDDEQFIVIDFDRNGTVSDLYFSLAHHEYKNFMSVTGEVADETRKKVILNFLEMMKNAYMKKDLAFIESMYSDKALIIVGRKLKQTDMKNVQLLDSDKETFFAPDKNNTEYTKMTKGEYMNRLKNVFRNNKQITVEFDSIQVNRHAKKDLKDFYGVKLEQTWISSSYGDVGYLFFVIEFREKDDPIVWVRAWQDKDAVDPENRIGFGDIQIK